MYAQLNHCADTCRLYNFVKQGLKNLVFITEHKLPVTRSYFIEHMQHIIQCLGLDSNKYSDHSFRIGRLHLPQQIEQKNILLKCQAGGHQIVLLDIKTPTNIVGEALISTARSSLCTEETKDMSQIILFQTKDNSLNQQLDFNLLFLVKSLAISLIHC